MLQLVLRVRDLLVPTDQLLVLLVPALRLLHPVSYCPTGQYAFTEPAVRLSSPSRQSRLSSPSQRSKLSSPSRQSRLSSPSQRSRLSLPGQPSSLADPGQPSSLASPVKC